MILSKYYIYYVFIIIYVVYEKISFVSSDFVYKDFNETAGLVFNGAAGTTSCFNFSVDAYGDVQGKADQFNEAVAAQIGESTVLVSDSSVETNVESSNLETQTTLAGFLHRSDQKSAPTKCNVRARLTPSGPSKAGSMWFVDAAPVSNGFDTYFTFQITDHSKQCTLNVDQYFSLQHHRTCSVHGGDGFAFVIQRNGNNSLTSLGEVGGQMGFGGIPNSLAIAFDTWQNPGQDTLFADHVSIQSRGQQPNDALEAGLLGVPRIHTLADGNIHLARITYYGDLRSEYFDKLVASDSLLPYLNDNGEQKRVGTLVVFVDDGVATNTPLLALPINLSLLVNLPDDKAFVGFTSSTGRFYEKHDILSWVWCDQEPCDVPSKQLFDYHQQSRFSSAVVRDSIPGPGFGGSDQPDKFPIKNTDPDTDPINVAMSSFSESRNVGLANDASNQVPPQTLY